MECIDETEEGEGRVLHACWALPGAILTIVLCFLLFFGQFPGGRDGEIEAKTVAAAKAPRAG